MNLLAAVLLLDSALAGCSTPTTATELESAVAAARAAHESRADFSTIATTAATVQATLACLVEPLTPQLAAEVHLLEGLRTLKGIKESKGTREAREAALLSFAAAYEAWSEVALPTCYRSTGYIGQLFQSVKTGTTSTTPLHAKTPCAVTLDGTTRERPIGRPVILQWRDARGAVGLTEYLPPGASPSRDLAECRVDMDDDGHALDDHPPDCDDASATVYPGADDKQADGVDSDCAGNDDYDSDSDGYVLDENVGRATSGRPGVLPGGECNDDDREVHPNVLDPITDRVDQDCNPRPPPWLVSTTVGGAITSVALYAAGHVTFQINKSSAPYTESNKGALEALQTTNHVVLIASVATAAATAGLAAALFTVTW